MVGSCVACLAFAACGDDGDPGGAGAETDAAVDASADADAGADAPSDASADAEAEASTPKPTAGECGAVELSKAYGGGKKGSLLSQERGLDVVTDASGHAFATGAYYGAADFGGGALVAGGDNRSMFVVHWDATGKHVQSRGFGDATSGVLYAPQATGHGIALRPGGGVVVAGSFAGSVDFGTGTPLVSAEQGGLDAGFCFACSPDIVVLSLDDQNATLWAKHWGDVEGDAALDVAVAPGGEVFVVGSFRGSLSFGLGAPLSSAGKADAFVVKLDATGAPLWAKRFGGPGDDVASAVVLDGSSLRVGGSFSGGADFGTGPTAVAGESDGFLIALAQADGAVTASRVLGAGQRAGITGLALGQGGALVASGYVRGKLSFAAKEHLTYANDAVVLAFDATGKDAWAKVFGTSENDAANAVVAAPGGNLLVTGSVGGGPLDLGGGPLFTNTFHDSAFVLELDASGAHVCSRRWNAEPTGEPIGDAATLGASVDGLGVAADPSGNVWVVGALTGRTDVGAGSLESSGGTDVLVVKTQP